MRREAAARGIVTDDLRASDELTSASLVLDASDGERTFLHNPGASAALTATDVERALERRPALASHRRRARAAQPRRRAAGRAAGCEPRARGIATSLDPVHDATGRWERLHPSLPHLDVICPNLTEARGITGQDVRGGLRRAGCASAASTRSPSSSVATARTRSTTRPPSTWLPSPWRPRDETGAGDAFAAGLIHGLLQGWPLARAVRLGNAVGALSTRGIGASSTLPDLEEALAL